MTLATAAMGAAIAGYCEQQPALPECVAYVARMNAMEPYLVTFLIAEAVVFAALVLGKRRRS